MKATAFALLLSLPLVTGCVTQTASDGSPVEAGQALAQQRCSSCHAVGLADASPREDAPALRDLYKRFPVDYLHEAFQRGIHVGHPEMPTFRLSRREADALLAYLRSIDPCARPSSDRAAMERCFAPL